MENKISVSNFKTHCLKILKDIQSNNQTITITKRNNPIAKIGPIEKNRKSLFGILEGKAEIKLDIIHSIEEKWDVENE